jgi:hypothetical protein
MAIPPSDLSVGYRLAAPSERSSPDEFVHQWSGRRCFHTRPHLGTPGAVPMSLNRRAGRAVTRTEIYTL